MSSSNIRKVRLKWTGEGLVFQGGAEDGPEITTQFPIEEITVVG